MAHYSNVAGRDEIAERRWGLAPSLALGLGTPTRLTLTYLHEDADDIPDYGIPWYFGRPAPVDHSNFYGYDSDYLRTQVNVLTAKVEHDLDTDVTVRNTFRLGQYRRQFRVSEGVLAPGTTASTPLDSGSGRPQHLAGQQRRNPSPTIRPKCRASGIPSVFSMP